MVKVSEFIIPLYKTALPLCEERKIRLNLDLNDPSVEMGAERGELNRVVKPFILGAIKRTPRGGSVTLGASAEKKAIVVIVKDTGTALPKSEREELSSETVEVHSRHGYGTTVTIRFAR